MFTKSKKEPTLIETIIETLETRLLTMDVNTKEYSNTLDRLAALYKLKESSNPLTRVSADTWALIIANIVGIGIIVGYEHLHPLPSKAIGFIRKL